MKLKINRSIQLGAVLLAGLLLFSGCTAPKNESSQAESRTDKVPTTNNKANDLNLPALKYYHLVSLDMPRAEVEALLGSAGALQADGQVAYTDPDSGYGVLINYSEDQLVFAKRLIPTSPAPELIALNPFPVTDKQAYRMAVGMPFYEVKGVMGSDGIEISLSQPQADTTKPITGRAWFNPDGSYAVVYLNLPKGQVVGSEFVNAGS
jgi:hypothetical protein